MTFFCLTVAFYWIADTSRRRILHLSLLVCTLILGVGSEIAQGILPNDRPFDLFDLVANVAGSLAAIGLCSSYHKRMLERRRLARFGGLAGEGNENDIELGLGGPPRGGEGEGTPRPGPQETGVLTLEEEVDRFDENAVDSYDVAEDADGSATPARENEPTPVHSDIGSEKKRSD